MSTYTNPHAHTLTHAQTVWLEFNDWSSVNVRRAIGGSEPHLILHTVVSGALCTRRSSQRLAALSVLLIIGELWLDSKVWYIRCGARYIMAIKMYFLELLRACFLHVSFVGMRTYIQLKNPRKTVASGFRFCCFRCPEYTIHCQSWRKERRQVPVPWRCLSFD